ncbi:alkane 1-monooxygenase [Urechidicola vernalis]|uniref:Alkane 1-monooxygenase n=1 Tax=Urechidicola vernalis TaxID=3075600 RepID=A0ABU2Y3M0_9FLAO|nr:alkane 1-monooxygenase [Urechidicola sp. P050]MDT0552801.1 alkane 1-monooxygenase [Urechidicola sp. P050]
MRKFKYFFIYILPLSAFVAFVSEGLFTFLPFILAFIIVPLLELSIKPDHSNLSKLEADIAKHSFHYRAIVYSMVPIQVGLLVLFLTTATNYFSTLEIAGRISSMGILCGIIGINVGHELGHNDSRLNQFLGELLLLTSLETHFLIYHNYGHHVEVATPNDPATARRDEWLYTFWFRSQIGSYSKAWQLQKKKLIIQKKAFISLENKMLWYTVSQLILCIVIFSTLGISILLQFIIAAIVGILLLETVNYIEHYGLLRKRKKSGRYELVNPTHSWNSNHIVGRILLFELSRHSDHHHRANKPYQILNSHKDSPQMVTGYPGMMFLALFPVIWIRVMNKKLPQ